MKKSNTNTKTPKNKNLEENTKIESKSEFDSKDTKKNSPEQKTQKRTAESEFYYDKDSRKNSPEQKRKKQTKSYQEFIINEPTLSIIDDPVSIKDLEHNLIFDNATDRYNSISNIYNYKTVYYAPDDFKVNDSGEHIFNRRLEFKIASPNPGKIKYSQYQGLAPKKDLNLSEMFEDNNSIDIEANKLYSLSILEYVPIQFKFKNNRELHISPSNNFYKLYNLGEVETAYNVEYVYNPFGVRFDGTSEYSEELSSNQDGIILHNSNLIKSSPFSGEFFEEKILTTISPNESDPSSVTRMSFGEIDDNTNIERTNSKTGVDLKNIVETSPTHLHPTPRKLELFTPNNHNVRYGVIICTSGIKEVISQSKIDDPEISRTIMFNPGSIITLQFDRNIHHRFIREDYDLDQEKKNPKISDSEYSIIKKLPKSNVDMMMGISAHGYDGPETVKACQKAKSISSDTVIADRISSVTLGSTNSMLSRQPLKTTRSNIKKVSDFKESFFCKTSQFAEISELIYTARNIDDCNTLNDAMVNQKDQEFKGTEGSSFSRSSSDEKPKTNKRSLSKTPSITKQEDSSSSRTSSNQNTTPKPSPRIQQNLTPSMSSSLSEGLKGEKNQEQGMGSR